MHANGFVKLSATHPTLYRSVLVFAFISIGLGLNFLFTNPTFNPYMIPKEITGGIFLTLGIGKLAAVYVFRRMLYIRVSMALCLTFMLFWGIGTSITFFQGRTSLQLFVLYMGLTLLQLTLLLEPFRNPLTAAKIKPR